MREKLFVRFPDRPEDGLQWVILSQDGEIESCVQNGTYEQLFELCPHRRIIGFAPGQYVTLTETVLPTNNRGKMLLVVPYAVEDELVSDVDDLHFAVGPSRKLEDDVPVAAIDRDVIEKWYEILHDHDITVDELIPDTLSVPYTQNGWTVVITDHTAIVRTGAYTGFATDVDTLKVTLKLAIRQQEEPPEQIRVVNFAQTALELPEIDDVEITELYDESQHLIQLLALNYSDAHQINLLQGEFSRRSQTLKLLTPWWPAVAIFVLWVGISAVNMSTEYVQLSAKNRALAQQFDTIFKETFPDKRLVPGASYKRLKQEWKKLKADMGGTDTNDPIFLELVDKIGATLKNTPGLDLANISFRQGVLNLELSLNNLQDLENLRTKLENSGGTQIEVVNVRAEGSRVMGRLRVQRA